MALGDTMLVAAETGSVQAWDVTLYGRHNARLEGLQVLALSESLELVAHMVSSSTKHNATHACDAAHDRTKNALGLAD